MNESIPRDIALEFREEDWGYLAHLVRQTARGIQHWKAATHSAARDYELAILERLIDNIELLISEGGVTWLQ